MLAVRPVSTDRYTTIEPEMETAQYWTPRRGLYQRPSYTQWLRTHGTTTTMHRINDRAEAAVKMAQPSRLMQLPSGLPCHIRDSGRVWRGGHTHRSRRGLAAVDVVRETGGLSTQVAGSSPTPARSPRRHSRTDDPQRRPA